MDCTTAREAVSARLDGELSPAMGEHLDQHLQGCRTCSLFATELSTASRRARLHAAPDVPDLVPAVTAAVAQRRERAPWSPARWGLVLVAITQVGLSGPPLLGHAMGTSLHAARELGVTELALAVGLLAAAWRPWRAAGMLPVVVALAVGLAVISVLDVVAGEVRLVHELPHLLPLAGALLLWQIRHRDPIEPRPAPVRRPAPRLRRSA